MQIVVCGMHRSGTSMVSRLVNLMGAYFGPEGVALPVNIENPKGFWERRDILALNDRILAHYGSLWYDLHPLFAAGGCKPNDLDGALRADLARLVQGLDASRPWFIKDPRLCVTLSCWLPLLDDPVALICARSPRSVVASLAKRSELIDLTFTDAQACALWETYTTSMLDATLPLRRIFVSYERFIEAPYEACRELFDALVALGARGLTMPQPAEIAAFVDPGLQRSAGRPSIELPARFTDLDNAVRSGRIEERHLRPDGSALDTLREFNAELEEERSYHYLQGIGPGRYTGIEREIALRIVQTGEPVTAWSIEKLARLAQRRSPP